MSHFQQIIAAVHLYTNRIEGLHHFSYVSDDSIFTIGKFCKKMMLNDRINAEFHFLRIHQNKLQFGRMLLIKQWSDDSVQADRFTLSGSTCHQYVRHFAKINHEYLIRNGFTKCNRQIIGWLLKLLTTYNRLSWNDLRIWVRHLDTDRTFSRYGSNDTNAQRRKAQSDIVFQATNLWNTYSLFRSDLIKSYRRSYRSFNRTYFNAKTTQCIDNTVFIRILFLHIDGRLTIFIVFHQIDSRKMIVL